MSELETLNPQPGEITAGGKTIIITPAKMRNIEPAIVAALPIIQALKSGKLDIKTLTGLDLANLETADILDLLEVYAEHAPAISQMVAYMAGVSLDELYDWDLPEYVTAFATVVRVNLDFFASLARQIPGAPVAAKAGQKPTGPNHSSD